MGHLAETSRTVSLTIRLGTPSDQIALARLAALDESRLPEGRLIVAEVDGELRAAISVTTRAAISDPFHPTAQLLALLDERADQLGGRRGRRKPERETLRVAPRALRA